MKNIPPDLVHRYTALLKEKGISGEYERHYMKWLRYYLDFCQKYQFDHRTTGSLRNFIEKLREKNQSRALQKQAQSAVQLYYELPRREAENEAIPNIKHQETVEEVQRPYGGNHPSSTSGVRTHA